MVISGLGNGDGLFFVIHIDTELGPGRDAGFFPQVVWQFQHAVLQIIEWAAILAVITGATDSGQMDGELRGQPVQGIHRLDQFHGGHLLFQNDHRAVQRVDLDLFSALKATDLERSAGNQKSTIVYLFVEFHLLLLITLKL